MGVMFFKRRKLTVFKGKIDFTKRDCLGVSSPPLDCGLVDERGTDRWFSGADVQQRLKAGFLPLLFLVSFTLNQESPRPSFLERFPALLPKPSETKQPLCFLSPAFSLALRF